MKKTLAILLAAIVALTLAACGSNGQKVLNQNSRVINGDVSRLQNIERLPVLRDSADLRIQNYYYTAEADPNKVWYLVTQGMNGNPTGYYTIRGPVENASDEVTNPQQMTCNSPGGYSPSCVSVGLAEPNGIYPGQSADHIAILADGAILRWEGQYQTSDQPFKVLQTPTVSINENAAISSTDTSKSVGGKVPPRP